MQRTIQVRVDDFIKNAADELFKGLGLDTSTAVRIFLTIAIETGGLPFEVKRPNKALQQAMRDVRTRKNLSKPFKSARDAVNSMLED